MQNEFWESFFLVFNILVFTEITWIIRVTSSDAVYVKVIVFVVLRLILNMGYKVKGELKGSKKGHEAEKYARCCCIIFQWP